MYGHGYAWAKEDFCVNPSYSGVDEKSIGTFIDENSDEHRGDKFLKAGHAVPITAWIPEEDIYSIDCSAIMERLWLVRMDRVSFDMYFDRIDADGKVIV